MIIFLNLTGYHLALQPTSGLCVRRGIWKTFSQELKPIKGTKVENISCCPSVFGPPDMALIVALRWGFIRRPSL